MVTRTVYRGTLEGVEEEIVMELWRGKDAPGQYEGRYFYPRHGVDIPLSGPLNALVEPKPYPKRSKAEKENDAGGVNFIWQGKQQGAQFMGEVVNPRTGQKRAFALTRVADYQPRVFDSKADLTEQNALYAYLKLQGHAVPVGKVVHVGALAYQQFRDPRSVFRFPRLTRHPDPEVLQKINVRLEQIHWKRTLYALECRASLYEESSFLAKFGAGKLGFMNARTTAPRILYLSPTLMSMEDEYAFYCNGAHEVFSYATPTFDLIRGEMLDWNRLFHAYVKDKDGYDIPSPALKALSAKIEKIRNGKPMPTMPTSNNIACVGSRPPIFLTAA
jgi:hypothetical protein